MSEAGGGTWLSLQGGGSSRHGRVAGAVCTEALSEQHGGLEGACTTGRRWGMAEGGEVGRGGGMRAGRRKGRGEAGAVLLVPGSHRRQAVPRPRQVQQG